MALNSAQQDFIKNAIIHLLDFPTDSNELQKEVIALKAAFENSEDKENEFYYLAQCLFKPESYFQKLENQQAHPITFWDVQSYIIELIEGSLKEVANQTKHKLEWDINNLFNKIPEGNKTKIFASKPAEIENSDSFFELPALEGKIYKRTLRIIENEESSAVFLDITINCEENKTEKTTIFLNQIYHNTEDTTLYLYLVLIQLDAERISLNLAADAALKMLKQQSIVSDEEKTAIYQEKSAKLVLTDLYYFDLLCNRKVAPTLLLTLQANAATNLLNNGIKDLIKHDIITIDEACGLDETSLSIATYPIYYRLLKDKKIKLSDVVDIHFARLKFLLHPFVANLVQSGRLNFLIAKNIHYHLQNILLSDLYVEYFARNTIDWNKFNDLMFYQSDALLDKRIAKLINEGCIAFSDVNCFTLAFCDLYQQFPYLLDWLALRVVNLEELLDYTPNSFSGLHARILASRLYRIFLNSPYKIDNNEDSISKLIDDITIFAENGNISDEQMSSMMKHYFIVFLQLKIQNLVPNLKSETIRLQFQVISDLIATPHQYELNFESIFSDLHKIAESILHHFVKHKRSHSDTFFKSIKHYPKDCDGENKLLVDFCRGVLAITTSPLLNDYIIKQEKTNSLSCHG